MLRDLFRESEVPTAKLKGSILSLRSTCEGLLGTESLGSLGLDFNLAQEPRGAAPGRDHPRAAAELGGRARPGALGEGASRGASRLGHFRAASDSEAADLGLVRVIV